MKVVRFEKHVEFMCAALAVLRDVFAAEGECARAVILPGGDTPLPIYNALEESPLGVDESLHVIISDERYVPESSDLYNYARMMPMLRSLGIPDERILHVDTKLPFEDAASDFDQRLSAFIECGGVVALALLGLGADGHTASLFTPQDIFDAEGKYAVAVKTGEGPDRISLAPDFLSLAEKARILTAGPGKEDVISCLEQDKGGVVAGMAISEISDSEVWCSMEKG